MWGFSCRQFTYGLAEILSARLPEIWADPLPRLDIGCSASLSVDRQAREHLNGFDKDLLRKVGVPLRHAQIGMAGELLNGAHRDPAHGET